MALRRNDNVSVSVTRHADGAITGSVSGAASDVGDVVERFGRGVGYGIERARLETGGGVYTSKCYECERSLSTANQAFYRKFCQLSVEEQSRWLTARLMAVFLRLPHPQQRPVLLVPQRLELDEPVPLSQLRVRAAATHYSGHHFRVQ